MLGGYTVGSQEFRILGRIAGQQLEGTDQPEGVSGLDHPSRWGPARRVQAELTIKR